MITRNRIFDRFFLLGILALFCCGTALARTWTDATGRTVEGEFVRINGAQVVLKLRGGKIAQVPVASLSVEDREHLRQLLEAEGIRVWTDIQGRQIEAKFLRVADQKVYVRFNDQTTPLPYEILSMADRRWVRDRVKDTNADELPPPDAESELSPPRFWTSADGVRAEAQFERMLPDGRVMLAAEHGTELVPVDKLSADDHDFLREQVVLPDLARLVPQRPQPPPTAVATAPPGGQDNVNIDIAPARPVTQPPVTQPPIARPAPAPRRPTPPRQIVSRTPTYSNPARKRQLICSKCGKAAPSGAKFGSPCTYCNSDSGNSAYGAGKLAGTIVRYGGIMALIAFFAGWIWRKFGG